MISFFAVLTLNLLVRPGEKVCSVCRLPKTQADFPRFRRAADGLAPHCKRCNVARSRSWYAENREVVLSKTPTRSVVDKRCFGCGQTKLATEFARHRISADGLMSRCKQCQRARHRVYYVDNRERIVAKNRTYDLAFPERKAERARARYVRIGDRINSQHMDRYRENREAILAARKQMRSAMTAEERAVEAARQRDWKKRNPELAKQVTHRRRARLVGATIVEIGGDDLRARMSVFGNRCAYCRERPMEAVEHVKALYLGGPHALSNLRPSCKLCNSRKGTMPPKVWLANIPQEAPLPLP